MKLLSILIPVYNTENYLDRCLNSILIPEILDQIELIAVNDGSKDHSADIIRKYQKKYPDTIVFIDKENGGHGSTINTGLKTATGKYFRVLDSDDWFDTIEFIRFMKDLNSCDEDVVVTPYTQEYVSNGYIAPQEYSCYEHNRIYCASELLCDDNHMYFAMASSTWKTELLRESGLQLFEHCFYVDMQYNLFPLPLLQTMRFLNYCVYRYYIGRQGQSVSTATLVRNIPIHQKVLTWMIEFYESNREKTAPAIRQYMSSMISMMYRTHVHLICRDLKDHRLAYKTIKEFDAWTKDHSPDIYELTNSFRYLRESRKIRFFNVLLFNRLFIKVKRLSKEY